MALERSKSGIAGESWNEGECTGAASLVRLLGRLKFHAGTRRSRGGGASSSSSRGTALEPTDSEEEGGGESTGVKLGGRAS